MTIPNLFSDSNKKNKTVYFLYILFLLPLVGTGIPAYLFAIVYLAWNIKVVKFKFIDLILIALLFFFIVIKTSQTGFQTCMVLSRYYFGFILFYLMFNNININLKLDKLLFIICSCVLIEALLINTILPVDFLPNFPKSDSGDFMGTTKIFGFYQRPYSIGTNSTITSTLIMVLVFHIFGFAKDAYNFSSNKLLLFSSFTVAILGSGTGYFLLLLFVIYKLRPLKNIILTIISAIFLFLLYYFIFIFDIGSFDGLDKISSFYIQFLIDFKKEQIEDVLYILRSNTMQIFFGRIFESPKDLVIWSDFAWLNLFESTGIFGIFFTLFVFFRKTNMQNYIPVLVFLIGALHYGAIYSLPGQILIGYFISNNYYRKKILQIQ